MRAIVQHTRGTPDVLALREDDMTEPRDDEALLRVRASSVSQAGWIAPTDHPFAARLAFNRFGHRRPEALRELGQAHAGGTSMITG